MIRKCKKCGISKYIDEFPDNKVKGKIYKRYSCKLCFSESRNIYLKKYRENNSEKKKNTDREYYIKNKTKILKKTKKYSRDNKEKISKYKSKWAKNKYKKDPFFRLINSHRSLIRSALFCKNFKKTNHTFEYLGCTKEELKKHIESQFAEGMTWDNYGEWHVDHRFPLSQFDLTKEDQRLVAFGYGNLSPMWKKNNLSKGNKLLFLENGEIKPITNEYFR